MRVAAGPVPALLTQMLCARAQARTDRPDLGRMVPVCCATWHGTKSHGDAEWKCRGRKAQQQPGWSVDGGGPGGRQRGTLGRHL